MIAFHSDMYHELKEFDIDKSFEFDYKYSKNCFIYFHSHPRTQTHISFPIVPSTFRYVRLDNLLTRGYYPNSHTDNETDDDNYANDIPSQKAINNYKHLKRVQEINDFMYSFSPKKCSTCQKRWYVTNSKIPGGVTLDILNPKKNKSLFQMNDNEQNECVYCQNDCPPPGLPKLYSKENNMDFGPMYDEISALTPFEEMLIAKVSTLVSVCTLTSTGFLSYQGHCVSFFKTQYSGSILFPERYLLVNLF